MNTIPELSKRINVNAHNKGFWDNGLELERKLLLIVSETTEAMEADRVDRYCNEGNYTAVESPHKTEEEWCQKFAEQIKNSFQDELADIAIRVFDLAHEIGFDLEKHILMKMRYNESRPYKHGKKY